MQYIATISSAGQITLPKALRTFLGVDHGSKIVIDANEKTETATIERQKTTEEIFAELDRIRERAIKKDPELAERIKKNAGKTVRELREEFENILEGKAYRYQYSPAYYYEQHPEEPRTPEIQTQIDEHNAILDYLLKTDPTFKNRVEEYRAN